MTISRFKINNFKINTFKMIKLPFCQILMVIAPTVCDGLKVGLQMIRNGNISNNNEIINRSPRVVCLLPQGLPPHGPKPPSLLLPKPPSFSELLDIVYGSECKKSDLSLCSLPQDILGHIHKQEIQSKIHELRADMPTAELWAVLSPLMRQLAFESGSVCHIAPTEGELILGREIILGKENTKTQIVSLLKKTYTPPDVESLRISLLKQLETKLMAMKKELEKLEESPRIANSAGTVIVPITGAVQPPNDNPDSDVDNRTTVNSRHTRQDSNDGHTRHRRTLWASEGSKCSFIAGEWVENSKEVVRVHLKEVKKVLESVSPVF